jgi:hypothetical protein
MVLKPKAGYVTYTPISNERAAAAIRGCAAACVFTHSPIVCYSVLQIEAFTAGANIPR